MGPPQYHAMLYGIRPGVPTSSMTVSQRIDSVDPLDYSDATLRRDDSLFVGSDCGHTSIIVETCEAGLSFRDNLPIVAAYEVL